MNVANERPASTDVIRAAADRFRSALEEGGLNSIGFRAFPIGACGDTCELLGEYFRESGFGDWMYWSGTRAATEPFGTHAWLTQNGLIVDITADQFNGVQESVIVTQDWGWYDHHFPVRLRARVAGLNYFSGLSHEVLSRDYQTLRERADRER